jgi:rare lipoprotein A
MKRALALIAALSLGGCVTRGPLPGDAPSTGIASFYGATGNRTASGEHYNTAAMTAAHKTLPFGTRVRVIDPNGNSVVVRINDRGPFIRGRIIDLSPGAARALGMTARGVQPVTLEIAQ